MINWLVREVINPLVKARHEANNIKIWVARHGVGIDVGKTFVARAGVRNVASEQTHNDLIFTGRAPNVAARLSALREASLGPIIITDSVYNMLNDAQKKYERSDSKVWFGALAREVGPYSLKVYHTNYWRHP